MFFITRPIKKINKKPNREANTSVNGSNHNFDDNMECLEKQEKKVDRVEEALTLLEDFYSTVRAIVERTEAMTVELAKLGKVCLSYFCVVLIFLLNLS